MINQVEIVMPIASNSVVELEPLCGWGYLDLVLLFCINLAVLNTVDDCSQMRL